MNNTESELGTMHGPWIVSVTEHARRHAELDGPRHPAYVLNPLGRPDELWCNTCQIGVIRYPEEGTPQ